MEMFVRSFSEENTNSDQGKNDASALRIEDSSPIGFSYAAAAGKNV
jgi:hypothetical protein